MACALDRVRKRIGVPEQTRCVREVFVRDAFSTNGHSPEGAVPFISARISEDHRQGHLAVAEVVADALAHGRGVGRIVDHVVAQLKGDSEILAIGFERVLGIFARLGDDGRNAARGSEQRRRLRADDLQIMILTRLEPALCGELVDFSLGNHRRGVAEDLEHAQRSIFDHQFERAAEQEVADEDARRIAPDEVGGALAAAHARAIDDIVVKQGCGVDEFDRRGELVVAGAGITEQGRGGERQHRPHALSAAPDQMTGKLGDQRDLALHALEDDGVDAVHVARDERHQRVEGGRALGA